MSEINVNSNGAEGVSSNVPGSEDAPENEVVQSARQHAEDAKRRADLTKKIGVGAAIGVGSAAIVAGLIYWKRDK